MSADANAAHLGQRKARWLASLSLLGAWLVVFGPALFTSRAPYFRDNLLTYLPLRKYIHERLLSGELPQWYPYEGAGVPLIGQIAVNIFHPATWLLLPLNFIDAVRWNIGLAYLVALLGAYRAAREFSVGRAAAVAAAFFWGLGGYAMSLTSLLPYAMSMAALPWVLFGVLRTVAVPAARHAAIVAAGLALVFLAGDPQGLFESAALVPIALWGRPASNSTRLKAAGWLAAAAGVAGLLVCVELLPARVSFASSVRLLGETTPDLRTFWALHPSRLFEFIWPPSAVGGAAEFLPTVYFGLGSLLLVSVGLWANWRRGWPWALLSALALVLAMGDFAGVLESFQTIAPPFARLRYPQKYLAFTWLAALPLLAAGAHALSERLRTRGLGWLVPVWIFAELAAANFDQFPLVDREHVDAGASLARRVRAQAAQEPAPRVASTVAFEPEFVGDVNAAQKVARAARALHADAAGLYDVGSLEPRLGAFSARYAIMFGGASEHVARRGGWANACLRVEEDVGEAPTTVGADSGVRLVPMNCKPRAFLARTDPVGRASEAMAWVDAHELTGESVVWERGPALERGVGSVRWRDWAPELLALDVETDRETALVIGDEWAEGWTARVDDVPTPIFKTLVALRGVRVPPGTHRVTMRYQTPMLKLGAGLSGVGLLLLLALAVVRRREARSSPPLAPASADGREV